MMPAGGVLCRRDPFSAASDHRAANPTAHGATVKDKGGPDLAAAVRRLRVAAGPPEPSKASVNAQGAGQRGWPGRSPVVLCRGRRAPVPFRELDHVQRCRRRHSPRLHAVSTTRCGSDAGPALVARPDQRHPGSGRHTPVSRYAAGGSRATTGRWSRSQLAARDGGDHGRAVWTTGPHAGLDAVRTELEPDHFAANLVRLSGQISKTVR